MAHAIPFSVCVTSLMACAGAAAQVAPPQVPENLKAPTTETVLLKALGKGKQIYVCSARPGDESQFTWVLDRPQADLIGEKGDVIGKHYKGPVWEAADGSKVGGQVQQRANAPNANAVPWLLLKATSHEGGGIFAGVTYIQRVDTEGGLAPATGCDKSHAGAEAPVDYHATYFFYGAQTAETPLQSLPYSPSLDLTDMDPSINPCEDLYRYSCGGWLKKNPIPSDQSSWSVYSKLTQDNERFLWGILEDTAKPNPARSPVEREIGDFFAACMDEPAVEKAGAGPLASELAAVGNLKSVADLPELLAREHLAQNFGMLFSFSANQDYADSSREIAFAGAGGLGLPDRDYYTKTDAKSGEIRAKYLEHVAQMLRLLGDTPPHAAHEAQAIMRIETALAKASLTRVEQRDPYKLFHKMDRAQLQALTPALDWTRYLKASGLGDLNEYNVSEPAFFKEVQTVLTGTPLADWKAYLRWHLVHARAAFLSNAFVEANFEFFGKYLRGTPEQRPRWKRCVQYVDGDLGEALGQVFVERTFGPDMKARTLTMTKEIEKAMEDDIKQLPWMSEATKQQALAKLHSVTNKVGYPDKWRDYSSIRIERGDFAGNVYQAAVFEGRRQLAKIGKPVDRGEWGMTPPTVNAYYDPQMNDINFPAGVLQPPVFDPKMDDAPNYGDTGGTIGHELTHGFDDEGRQFDAHGNLHDWWTAADAKEFQKRADCVADQYAQYTVVDDIKINSRLTLGEDVADLGGEILAYIAWKDATRDRKLTPIDGFSPEQRFFIGFAQWACGDERAESKRVHAITDPHSPPEYRINGVAANMPDFAGAFGCKVGQPMVRKDPCRVW
jgi:putative endopeptidase